MTAQRLPGRVAPLLGGAPVVVVVCDDDLDLSALRAPGRELRVHGRHHGVTALHESLSGEAHVDAVVDLARGPGAARRLPMLLGHVRRGGLLVVAVPRAPEARAALLGLVEEVRGLDGPGLDPPARRRDLRPRDVQDLHALASTVEQLEVSEELVTLRKRVETWNVVRESRFDALLESHPSLGRVLVRRDPASRATSAAFSSTSPGEGPVVHDAPALSLRRLDDVVVSARAVARARDLVLPQAFRNTERARPRSPTLTDWSPWAVRVPTELEGTPRPTRLRGTWFHADNLRRGHFGHAMTEQLSHLWAWADALAHHPDVGVLVSSPTGAVAGWELDLLEAAGVGRDRVHASSAPVLVDRLLTATPGYVIGRHVHPSLLRTYAQVGESLERRSGLRTTPRRVFVTRPGSKRHCYEAAEVERRAVRHGFTVVSPEEHPLPDQVAVVRNAEVVAGYAGSGMFHLLLGGPPRPVVVLTHTDYHAWNEKAMSALWDHPLSIVRGTPVAPDPSAPGDAMHSDYHLDPDLAETVLRDALDR